MIQRIEDRGLRREAAPAGPGAAPAAVKLAAELAGVELPGELKKGTPSDPHDFEDQLLIRD